jgi:hypothetical protein
MFDSCYSRYDVDSGRKHALQNRTLYLQVEEAFAVGRAAKSVVSADALFSCFETSHSFPETMEVICFG